MPAAIEKTVKHANEIFVRATDSERLRYVLAGVVADMHAAPNASKFVQDNIAKAAAQLKANGTFPDLVAALTSAKVLACSADGNVAAVTIEPSRLNGGSSTPAAEVHFVSRQSVGNVLDRKVDWRSPDGNWQILWQCVKGGLRHGNAKPLDHADHRRAEDFVAEVMKGLPSDTPVFATGHSRGGRRISFAAKNCGIPPENVLLINPFIPDVAFHKSVDLRGMHLHRVRGDVADAYREPGYGHAAEVREFCITEGISAVMAHQVSTFTDLTYRPEMCHDPQANFPDGVYMLLRPIRPDELAVKAFKEMPTSSLLSEARVMVKRANSFCEYSINQPPREIDAAALAEYRSVIMLRVGEYNGADCDASRSTAASEAMRFSLSDEAGPVANQSHAFASCMVESLVSNPDPLVNPESMIAGHEAQYLDPEERAAVAEQLNEILHMSDESSTATTPTAETEGGDGGHELLFSEIEPELMSETARKETSRRKLERLMDFADTGLDIAEFVHGLRLSAVTRDGKDFVRLLPGRTAAAMQACTKLLPKLGKVLNKGQTGQLGAVGHALSAVDLIVNGGDLNQVSASALSMAINYIAMMGLTAVLGPGASVVSRALNLAGLNPLSNGVDLFCQALFAKRRSHPLLCEGVYRDHPAEATVERRGQTLTRNPMVRLRVTQGAREFVSSWQTNYKSQVALERAVAELKRVHGIDIDAPKWNRDTGTFSAASVFVPPLAAHRTDDGNGASIFLKEWRRLSGTNIAKLSDEEQAQHLVERAAVYSALAVHAHQSVVTAESDALLRVTELNDTIATFERALHDCRRRGVAELDTMKSLAALAREAATALKTRAEAVHALTAISLGVDIVHDETLDESAARCDAMSRLTRAGDVIVTRLVDIDAAGDPNERLASIRRYMAEANALATGCRRSGVSEKPAWQTLSERALKQVDVMLKSCADPHSDEVLAVDEGLLQRLLLMNFGVKRLLPASLHDERFEQSFEEPTTQCFDPNDADEARRRPQPQPRTR